MQVIKLNSLIDNGDVDGVSKLLSQNVALNPKKGADLNILHIPLFRAVHRGDCRIIELLFKGGADPDIEGKVTYGSVTERFPPLVFAARQAVSDKAYDVFEKLLKCGANPYSTIMICRHDIGGRHSMDSIVPLGDWMLRKILLENGYDPDTRDGQGYTLLHKGCRTLDKQLVYLLLLFNADLEIPCQIRPYNKYAPQKPTEIDKYINVAPFESMALYFCKLIKMHETDWDRALKVIRIARALAMAGAEVHKDTVTGKCVTALHHIWTWMENTVEQSAVKIRKEERQEVIDCIHFIKHRLTHPVTLAELCSLRIRRILKSDFHRKLARLHLPRLIEDFIAMKDMFSL